MPSPRIRSVIINTTNAEALAAFWAGFLDLEVPDHEPDASMIWLRSEADGSVDLGLQLVAETSQANETHLDIEVADLDIAQQNIESLGGSIVKVNRLASGFEWRVAADAHGNHFCIFAS